MVVGIVLQQILVQIEKEIVLRRIGGFIGISDSKMAKKNELDVIY